MRPENNIIPSKSVLKVVAHLMLFLLCVFSLFLGASAAKAQADPVLKFALDPISVYLNGAGSQFNVDLMAENVVDMGGYEFVLSYDPTLLEFVSITPGTWLSPVFSLPIQPPPPVGVLHFAYAKVGNPTISGNGKLATLTFKAIGFGSSALNFSDPLYCKYSRPDGTGIPHYFDLQHGTVSSTFNPAIVANSAVAGTFSLQGQATTGGVPVILDDGQFLDDGPFSGTTTNQSGSNLSIAPVVMDLYTVTTAQARYLNIDEDCGMTKAVFGTVSTLSPLKLLGGNAVWSDNEITIDDIALIAGEYGNPSTPEDPLDADVNFNGTVDVFDLAMAAGNYELTCATAYADWKP